MDWLGAASVDATAAVISALIAVSASLSEVNIEVPVIPGAAVAMSGGSFDSYVRLSPNHSGARRHPVTKITLHYMGGN